MRVVEFDMAQMITFLHFITSHHITSHHITSHHIYITSHAMSRLLVESHPSVILRHTQVLTKKSKTLMTYRERLSTGSAVISNCIYALSLAIFCLRNLVKMTANVGHYFVAICDLWSRSLDTSRATSRGSTNAAIFRQFC